jgi:hypothetical protein
METLIRDALKDFETFKELTETIPLEVLGRVFKLVYPSKNAIATQVH